MKTCKCSKVFSLFILVLFVVSSLSVNVFASPAIDVTANLSTIHRGESVTFTVDPYLYDEDYETFYYLIYNELPDDTYMGDSDLLSDDLSDSQTTISWDAINQAIIDASFDPNQDATLYFMVYVQQLSDWYDEYYGYTTINYSASSPKPKQIGPHELVTLMTNPTDGTGLRTTDLNYYLNDPVIWQTDVKNITVWLESEIFDLAAAQQKAKLPAGLTLLMDYNIRLMMKIVYNDGSVVTKEADNADIARNIPVLIPIDEFAGQSDLGIVYIDTQGNTAVLPVTPVTLDGKNYLQFENNHFSEYGVVSGTAAALAVQQTYIIKPGDTLASIAAQFGVTVQSLAAANNIADLDLIFAGKTLIIA